MGEFSSKKRPKADPSRQEALVEALRAAARAEVLPRFRALAAHEIAAKSGPGDLVTLADTRAEAAIIARMAETAPGLRVIGEEGVAGDNSLRAAMGAGAVAIIDPIDGTWNYAKGLATFGMIGAIAEAGRPVFGLLYDPVFDDWIAASAAGPAEMVSAAGRRPLETSPELRPERLSGYLSTGLYPRTLREPIFAASMGLGRVGTLRCSCHEYRMLALGHVQFVLSGPVPHPWDHAAGALVAERAGGVARYLDGGAYCASRIEGALLTASSEAAWQAVADRFSFLA